MKFISKPEPEVGSKRIITRFLFLPMTIYDETRWLETVSYEIEYKPVFHCFEDGGWYPEWRATKWL